MLVHPGLTLTKLWFSVSRGEQRTRFIDWLPLPTTAALCKAVQDTPETLEEHFSPEHYSTLLY
jgi:hypothetical protein